VCRLRKTLKYFCFSKAFFAYACSWCYDSVAGPERTEPRDILRCRTGIAVRQLRCKGHPICGSCYNRNGLHFIRDQTLGEAIGHNPQLQRLACGTIEYDDGRQILRNADEWNPYDTPHPTASRRAVLPGDPTESPRMPTFNVTSGFGGFGDWDWWDVTPFREHE
jgi:hypothetical protein